MTPKHAAEIARGDVVPRGEFKAVLRMLIRRATLWDRLRAWRSPGHWLNRARREVLAP